MTSASMRKPGHNVLGKVVMTAVAVVAGIAIMAVPASAAAPPTVYDNTPEPLPGTCPASGTRRLRRRSSVAWSNWPARNATTRSSR